MYVCTVCTNRKLLGLVGLKFEESDWQHGERMLAAGQH